MSLRSGLAALVCFLAALASFTLAYWSVEDRISRPFQGYAGQERILVVSRGETVNGVIGQLESEGLIESQFLFRLYTRFREAGFVPKAGRYRFQGPLSMVRIAQILHEGRIDMAKITVPEGLDLEETISLLVSGGFGSRERYVALSRSTGWIRDLDGEARTLEGFLFPETYLVPVGAGEEQILKLMVDHLRRVWSPERQERALSLGRSLREILTLASLIEKEASLASERPLVSAVFHNRLRLSMKLASDPTVVYAVKQVEPFDGVIHRSDLAIDSPYNTYLYPGLPPGPIANPGLAAIDAALNPADVDYLFFVSKNDGSHFFSDNYRDHHRAVRQYQRKGR